MAFWRHLQLPRAGRLGISDTPDIHERGTRAPSPAASPHLFGLVVLKRILGERCFVE